MKYGCVNHSDSGWGTLMRTVQHGSLGAIERVKSSKAGEANDTNEDEMRDKESVTVASSMTHRGRERSVRPQHGYVIADTQKGGKTIT